MRGEADDSQSQKGLYSAHFGFLSFELVYFETHKGWIGIHPKMILGGSYRISDGLPEVKIVAHHDSL